MSLTEQLLYYRKMDRYRELWKRVGDLVSKKEKNTESFLQGRKEKRSRLFDSKRDPCLLAKGFINDKPNFEEKFKNKRRKSLRKTKVQRKRVEQPEIRVRPFVVGVVRHKIHSPPFLHQSVRNSDKKLLKKRNEQTPKDNHIQSKNNHIPSKNNQTPSKKKQTPAKSFAPRNYKFQGPKGLNSQKSKVTPVIKSDSPFTLESVFAKREKPEQVLNHNNVTLHRPRVKKANVGLQTTPNLEKEAIVASDIYHDEEEPPIFGRENVAKALARRTMDFQVKENKENIPGLGAKESSRLKQPYAASVIDEKTPISQTRRFGLLDTFKLNIGKAQPSPSCGIASPVVLENIRFSKIEFESKIGIESFSLSSSLQDISACSIDPKDFLNEAITSTVKKNGELSKNSPVLQFEDSQTSHSDESPTVKINPLFTRSKRSCEFPRKISSFGNESNLQSNDEESSTTNSTNDSEVNEDENDKSWEDLQDSKHKIIPQKNAGKEPDKSCSNEGLSFAETDASVFSEKSFDNKTNENVSLINSHFSKSNKVLSNSIFQPPAVEGESSFSLRRIFNKTVDSNESIVSKEEELTKRLTNNEIEDEQVTAKIHLLKNKELPLVEQAQKTPILTDNYNHECFKENRLDENKCDSINFQTTTTQKEVFNQDTSSKLEDNSKEDTDNQMDKLDAKKCDESQVSRKVNIPIIVIEGQSSQDNNSFKNENEINSFLSLSKRRVQGEETDQNVHPQINDDQLENNMNKSLFEENEAVQCVCLDKKTEQNIYSQRNKDQWEDEVETLVSELDKAAQCLCSGEETDQNIHPQINEDQVEDDAEKLLLRQNEAIQCIEDDGLTENEAVVSESAVDEAQNKVCSNSTIGSFCKDTSSEDIPGENVKSYCDELFHDDNDDDTEPLLNRTSFLVNAISNESSQHHIASSPIKAVLLTPSLTIKSILEGNLSPALDNLSHTSFKTQAQIYSNPVDECTECTEDDSSTKNKVTVSELTKHKVFYSETVVNDCQDELSEEIHHRSVKRNLDIEFDDDDETALLEKPSFFQKANEKSKEASELELNSNPINVVITSPTLIKKTVLKNNQSPIPDSTKTLPGITLHLLDSIKKEKKDRQSEVYNSPINVLKYQQKYAPDAPIIDLISDDEPEEYESFLARVLKKVETTEAVKITHPLVDLGNMPILKSSPKFSLSPREKKHSPVESVSVKQAASSIKTPKLKRLATNEDSPKNVESPMRVLSLRNRKIGVTPSPKKTPRKVNRMIAKETDRLPVESSKESPIPKSMKAPKNTRLVSEEISPRTPSLEDKEINVPPSPSKTPKVNGMEFSKENPTPKSMKATKNKLLDPGEISPKIIDSPIRTLTLRNKVISVSPSPRRTPRKLKLSPNPKSPKSPLAKPIIQPIKSPKIKRTPRSTKRQMKHLAVNEEISNGAEGTTRVLRNRIIDVTPSPRKTPRSTKKKTNERI